MFNKYFRNESCNLKKMLFQKLIKSTILSQKYMRYTQTVIKWLQEYVLLMIARIINFLTTWKENFFIEKFIQ